MKVVEFNHLALVCEFVLLFFQAIYVLEKTSDQKRIWHLCFVLFQAFHSVCNELQLFDAFHMPEMLRVLLIYGSGTVLSMYFVYYFFKVSHLKSLRFLSTYGPFLFLLLPFVVTFVIPYIQTGNVAHSLQIGVTMPFLYSVAFVALATYSLIGRLKTSEKVGDGISFFRLLPYYIGLLCWSAMHLVVFHEYFDRIESVVTNICFLIISTYYLISVVKDAKLQSRQVELMREESRQRTNAIINLTHDTKTPLTLVYNYFQDFRDQFGGVIAGKDLLTAIEINLERLTSSLQNLSDAEKIRMGTELYNHNHITDFSRALYQGVILFRIIAGRKGITMVDEIPSNLLIKAHPEAVERLVNNLLENAIRYTAHGGRIETKLASVKGKIHFIVTDNGIGIPAEMHNKIFDPYFQIPITGKPTEGIGVGLSIVNQIVNDLQGSIHLHSSPGEGTTFTLIFDRYFLQTGEQLSESPSFPLSSTDLAETPTDKIVDPERPYIMIVEDNEDMLYFLASHLENRFNVLIAANGKDALEKLNNIARLDLIVSDIVMSGMDGIHFFTTVSKLPRFQHIPFIFLTAYPDHKSEGLELGAIDFIEKPFLIKDLVRKIDSILSNLKKQREALISRAYNDLFIGQSPSTHPPEIKVSAFESNCRKYGLTPREIQIANQLISGQPYKLIAVEMGISAKTVANHITNIFEKTGAQNKVELLHKLDWHSDLQEKDQSPIKTGSSSSRR